MFMSSSAFISEGVRKVCVVICCIAAIIISGVNLYSSKIPDTIALAPIPVPGQVVFLGDSITARGLWHQMLPEVKGLNFGVGSDYTDSVLARLEPIIEAEPQKVYLMVGINDTYRGDKPFEIFMRYREIVERLSPHSQVVIQSTIQTGHPEHIDKRRTVQLLNEYLKVFALENGLDFIDLNEKMSPDGYLAEKYTGDGIHLNADGYGVWAKVLRKYLEQQEHIVASRN